jgi:hypothetical protein
MAGSGRYTPEVEAALAKLRGDDSPPESGAIDGQLRYFVAVEATQHQGNGDRATVVALLRTLADSLEAASVTDPG